MPTDPDRSWRPSDAERDRYATIIAAAYADGRIDAGEMQEKTAAVYRADTVGDLDVLVERLPAPEDRPPRGGVVRRAGVVAATVAVALAGWLGVDALTGGDERAPAAPAAPGDPPAQAPVAGPFGTDALDELAAALDAAGITDIHQLVLTADATEVTARAATRTRALATVQVTDGVAGPPVALRELADAETDALVFLRWSDLDTDAVAGAALGAAAAAGTPGAEVMHVRVGRGADGGIVVEVGLSTGARVDTTGDGTLLRVVG